jgi:hypothetical protein
MRAVGVKSQEGNVFINEVLGHDPCYDGFADPAFFAANEMNFVHIKCKLPAVEDKSASVVPG